MECQKVRSKDAAKLLGMSLSRMHALMDRKQLDIGVVLQPLPGRKNRSYEVYKSKLYKHLGLDDDTKEIKKSRLPRE